VASAAFASGILAENLRRVKRREQFSPTNLAENPPPSFSKVLNVARGLQTFTAAQALNQYRRITRGNSCDLGKDTFKISRKTMRM
jgi:hypothetical protein